MDDLMAEEEKEESIENEEVEEEKPEEEMETEEERELSQSEITPVPLILCPECEEPMEIDGIEVKDIEKRKFIIKTTTETHRHLRYVCSDCGTYFLYDLERERQGCFIATAAYGTPMAEEINVLRKFRDSYLVHKDWGKKLVSLYYTVSPPIADVIGKSEAFKKVVRTALLPIVRFFEEEYSKDDKK